jgi:hypothetical protein
VEIIDEEEAGEITVDPLHATDQGQILLGDRRSVRFQDRLHQKRNQIEGKKQSAPSPTGLSQGADQVSLAVPGPPPDPDIPGTSPQPHQQYHQGDTHQEQYRYDRRHDRAGPHHVQQMSHSPGDSHPSRAGTDKEPP